MYPSRTLAKSSTAGALALELLGAMHLRRVRVDRIMAARGCSEVSGLVGASVIVPVSISCVRGVHVVGLSHTPGGAGFTWPSAEAAGGVKTSASAPSEAS